MATMRAYTFGKFGMPGEVMRLGSVELPPMDDGKVLVKVKAVGLNPLDYYVIDGTFFADRVKHSFPVIPSYDFSGIVEEVGSKVTKFKKGDEVYGCDLTPPQLKYGALAEFVAVPEMTIAMKPGNVSHVQAAGVPIAMLTAQEALDRGGLKQGGKVLITNGSGGVGIHAIQLAKVVYKASEIATTASLQKHTFLASLGATKLIDYKLQSFDEVLSGYDMVLDATKESDKALRIINSTGKVVTISNFAAKPPVEVFSCLPTGQALEGLQPYLESEEIRVILDKTTPWRFDQATEAMTHLASQSVTGKVVVEL